MSCFMDKNRHMYVDERYKDTSNYKWKQFLENEDPLFPNKNQLTDVWKMLAPS